METTEEMISRIASEAKAEADRIKADKERKAQIVSILKPYAQQGLTFGQVMARENCPVHLDGLYQQLLQETAQERQAKADNTKQEQGEDLFLKGFMSDPNGKP